METAEETLRRPARLGYPVPIAKLPSNLLEPEFSTAIGMVLYGHRARQGRTNSDRGFGARLKALFARQNVTVLPGSYLSREAHGVNPGRDYVRMALVATIKECVEAANRIKEFVAGL